MFRSFVFVANLLAAVAAAQEVSQLPEPAFQTGTKLVLVPVVVRDGHGHPVDDLPRDSFRVSDQGKERRIASFSIEKGDGATLAAPNRFVAYFLDDLSLTDFGSVVSVREALRRTVNPGPNERAAIFSSSCQLAQDFTNDSKQLQETITRLQPNAMRVCRVARRESVDLAVLAAIVQRMAHLPGQRRIFVISKGFPVSRDEQKAREQLIDNAVQAKVEIDALHMPDASLAASSPDALPGGFQEHKAPQGLSAVDSENLNIVADGTGGRVLEAGNAPEVALRELAARDCIYLLGFEPDRPDNTYHKLKVALRDSRKLSLRARDGYWSSASATKVESPAPRLQPAHAPVEAVAPTPATLNLAPERAAVNGPVTFRSRASVVLVPVVVRDRAGRSIGGLKNSDFDLRDRSQPQTISSFSEQKLEAAQLNGSSRTATLSSSAAPSALPVIPDRFTAYLFDDVHMRISDLAQVRAAVWRNIQESLAPTERAAVFTTSRRIITDFTSDRETLRAAMFRITPVAAYRSACDSCGDLPYFLGYQVTRGNTLALREAVPIVSSAPSSQTSEMSAEMAANRAMIAGERETELSLTLVRDVSRHMSGLAGRRSIVLLSHGFFIADEQQQELAQTIDWALRCGVVIHTLNSSGLLTGAEQFSRYEDDTAGNGSFTNAAQQEGAVALRTIADGTGGTAVDNNNDYLSSVRRLAVPPEFRYVIGFTPRDFTADGSFHPLSIKLAGPQYNGYAIQARRGYYAPKRTESLAGEAAKEIENAVFSRDEVHDLPVDWTTEVLHGEATGPELVVREQVDLRFLNYLKADGRNQDDLTAITAIFDSDGNFLAGKQQTLKLRLRDETLAGLGEQSRETLETWFDLSPGTYLVRLVVRSHQGQTMTASSKVFEIH